MEAYPATRQGLFMLVVHWGIGSVHQDAGLAQVQLSRCMLPPVVGIGGLFLGLGVAVGHIQLHAQGFRV